MKSIRPELPKHIQRVITKIEGLPISDVLDARGFLARERWWRSKELVAWRDTAAAIEAVAMTVYQLESED